MNLMAIMLGHDPEKLYEEGLKRMTEEERKILEAQSGGNFGKFFRYKK